jgi:uncharacterized protein (TIGR00162 family)
VRETFVKELVKPELRSPVLVEGLPGLGLVGKIAVRHLIRQLGAKKFGFLYSPHFPYFVIVSKKGSVRLLRGAFYYWKNLKSEGDVVLFTGDSQAQTIEGQYEISDKVLEFAKRYGVKLVVTIGGYRMEAKGKPRVIAAATSREFLDGALKAGAEVSPAGSPIVGTAGLILGLSHFSGIEALCLLGETRGYLPDPQSAKSVLEVLQGLLGFDANLAGLDEEIAKGEKMVTRLQRIEEKRVLEAEENKKEEDKKVTYIS